MDHVSGMLRRLLVETLNVESEVVGDDLKDSTITLAIRAFVIRPLLTSYSQISSISPRRHHRVASANCSRPPIAETANEFVSRPLHALSARFAFPCEICTTAKSKCLLRLRSIRSCSLSECLCQFLNFLLSAFGDHIRAPSVQSKFTRATLRLRFLRVASYSGIVHGQIFELIPGPASSPALRPCYLFFRAALDRFTLS